MSTKAMESYFPQASLVFLPTTNIWHMGKKEYKMMLSWAGGGVVQWVVFATQYKDLNPDTQHPCKKKNPKEDTVVQDCDSSLGKQG